MMIAGDNEEDEIVRFKKTLKMNLILRILEN